MRWLYDHDGVAIHLTDERRAHILEHPEMRDTEAEIERTLLHPERFVRSLTDPRARLYYRFYSSTAVGPKFLCVVVKRMTDDAFVLTAYFTDQVKKGDPLWPPPSDT